MEEFLLKLVLKRREALYLICYSAFIVTMFLFEEVVNKPRIRWVLCPCLALGMILAIIIEKRHSFQQILIRLIVLLLFVVAAVASGKPEMVAYGALLCGAMVTDFKNIVKVCIGTSSITILLVAVANLFGLTPHSVYHQDDGTYIYTFGFGYYSIIPYTYLFVVLGYLYLRSKERKRATLAEMLVIILVNYILYRITTVRTTYYLCYAVIVLYLFLVKFNWLDLRNGIIKFLSVLVFPLLFTGTLWLNINFSMQDSTMVAMNNLLSNRLFLGNLALERYKIGIFGQEIMTNAKKGNDYFYIDSGYLYSVIGYGALFTLMALIIYTLLIKTATEENDKVMFIWVLTVAVFSFSNNTWISMYINPLLLYYPIILKKIKSRTIQEKKQNERKKRKKLRFRLN